MIGYSIFGDSISTFRGMIPPENRWFYDACDINGTGVCDPSQTWWGRIIEHENAELIANASFSGAMVEGIGFPAGCSKDRAEQIVGDGGRLPDIVLIYMGINDYGWGTPEAQAAGGSVASPLNYDECKRPINKPFDIDGPSAKSYEGHNANLVSSVNIDSTSHVSLDAPLRFQNAYENMIANIKDVVPKAEIRCLTLSPGKVLGKNGHFCYTLRGIELDDYNLAIKHACENKGATCVDIRSLGLDYSSIDGTHPDIVGMRQLEEMYYAALGDKYALDSYEAGMKSERLQDEAVIRSKLITPTSWSCYFLED